MSQPITNAELQLQIKNLDDKVDDRHRNNQELLGDIAKKMDTLIDLNLGQKLQAQLIEQLIDKTKAHDAHFVELFKRISKVESSTHWHGAIWKIVGGVLIASLGVFGWMLTQMKEFYHYENRVDTLEFLVQGRTTPVPPPSAQTSSGQ